jgi:hypothetical protein
LQHASTNRIAASSAFFNRRTRSASEERLAGCGKTIVARWTCKSPHIWGMGKCLAGCSKRPSARPQRVKFRGVPSGVR